jgi:8-oxo-dGTP pyrophosphatase MutT (NUDIX family)
MSPVWGTSVKEHEVSGTICQSPQHRYLLVKGRRGGKWSFPKGHREDGETNLECALRETIEETGLDLREKTHMVSYNLYAGEYFYFAMEDEPTPQPNDLGEIAEARWVTEDEMRGMRVNVDVNRYLLLLRRQGRRSHQPPPPSNFPFTGTHVGMDDLSTWRRGVAEA